MKLALLMWSVKNNALKKKKLDFAHSDVHPMQGQILQLPKQNASLLPNKTTGAVIEEYSAPSKQSAIGFQFVLSGTTTVTLQNVV